MRRHMMVIIKFMFLTVNLVCDVVQKLNASEMKATVKKIMKMHATLPTSSWKCILIVLLLNFFAKHDTTISPSCAKSVAMARPHVRT